MITRIRFLGDGLGQVGVPGGSLEKPVFYRVGSVGEPLALHFLCLQWTSVNSWLTDDMISFRSKKSKRRYGKLTQRNYK